MTYAWPSNPHCLLFSLQGSPHTLQLPLQPHACRCLDKVEVSASEITLASFHSQNAFGGLIFLPSIFPCSVSTRTQSNPHRAIVLAWLLPGSICHAPNVSPEPVLRAFWSRFAACILILCDELKSERNAMWKIQAMSAKQLILRSMSYVGW